MPRKTLFIIIAVFFLVIIGALALYSSTTNQTGGVDRSERGILSFFPFGQGSTPPAGTNGNGVQTGTGTGTTAGGLPRLRHLTTVPVAGIVGLMNGSEHFVRYVERATGHAYDVPVDTSAQTKRVSNTTIPKIQEARWSPDGASLLLRYLGPDNETVLTFSGSFTGASTSEKTLQGTFFPKNILNCFGQSVVR